MTNINFFYATMAAYLLASAAYCAYFIKPERKVIAGASLWMTAAGLALHAAYFTLRWSEASFFPITTFFEAVNFLGLGIVLVFIVMEFRYKIPALGFFMLPLVVILMIPAAFTPSAIGDLKPILKSNWLGVHTSLSMIGDAAFAFSFIVSVMYLMQERQLKAKRLGAVFHRLPPLDIMDALIYRSLTFGWPLFTLGMVTGSIWAESAWGSYWNWDPKQTSSLITWVIYLVFLHLRTIGWRGRKMAYLSIIGFAFVLLSFYVVSRVGIGKHSF